MIPLYVHFRQYSFLGILLWTTCLARVYGVGNRDVRHEHFGTSGFHRIVAGSSFYYYYYYYLRQRGVKRGWADERSFLRGTRDTNQDQGLGWVGKIFISGS